MLTRTQPRTLDDLAVQVAIVRPGPIVGGAVNPYVRRRELQREDSKYVPRADHPILDQLLADTLGVILYQDQVLEVAIEMGGFTPGQADQFRRSMSRRRSREAMERFRTRFLEGAVRKGVKPHDAGDGVRQAVRVFGVRFSQEPRVCVRGAGLSVGLAATLLPGRVLRGAAEQPADGLLRPARADRRRQATPLAGLARRDQRQRGALQARGEEPDPAGPDHGARPGQGAGQVHRRRTRAERFVSVAARSAAACGRAAQRGRAPDHRRRAERVRDWSTRAAVAAGFAGARRLGRPRIHNARALDR